MKSFRLLCLVIIILISVRLQAAADTQATDSLPVWHFSVLASISDSTAEYYGGLEAISGMIRDQFESINEKFNRDGVFNGRFLFEVDSFQTYSCTPQAQANKAHPGHDF